MQILRIFCRSSCASVLPIIVLQNLGEAEYVISTYQYMRLCGYPADKISILTTYNGQKQLLLDIAQRRCAPYPYFGMPDKIETVDKFQGQQNDYILLSLVRTKNVGYLRDVRRMIVALSRARLGLYIFCRAKLFTDCYELAPAFSQLATKPTQLHLLLGEQHPSGRKVGDGPGAFHPQVVEGPEQMATVVSQVLTAQFMVMASMAASAAAGAPAPAPAIAASAEQLAAAATALTQASEDAAAAPVEVEDTDEEDSD